MPFSKAVWGATKLLSKYVYKKFLEQGEVSKAVEATSEHFEGTVVSVALYKWIRSDSFARLFFSVYEGELGVTDAEFVNSFITEADLYFGDDEGATESYARAVLTTFESCLREELLKAEDGNVILSNQIRQLHEVSEESGRQRIQDLKEHISGEFHQLARVVRSDAEDDDQARQIGRLLEAARPHTERRRIQEAGGIASALLPKMTAAVQRGQDGIRVQVVVDSIDRLIELDPRFVTLLPDRAELQDTRGRFDDSLADLQRYVNSPSAVIDSGVMLKVGVLLMSLGNWTSARRVLRMTRRIASDRRQEVMSRFFELWIDDYQRKRGYVLSECVALLSSAEELGEPALTSMIEHRLGRIEFAASLESDSGGLMEESFRRFKSAKRREEQAGGYAQPYHDMWLARVAESLAVRDRSSRFEQARESAEEAGGGWVAHVDLSEAHRAMRRGDWFKARFLLVDAMAKWKPLPYPKGIFDVSYMLGRVCKELRESIEALTYLWLAIRLGSRLKLPLMRDAEILFGEVVQTAGVSRDYAVAMAEESLAEQSFSRILKGWRFTIPTWKVEGSETSRAGKI